ncbi:methyltransferase domain-containing protein [Candidatus Poribacteria bacterium]|nr:methyltransferase domain-containing protein [Candidatus Poribacteria bacterium]
MNPVLDQIKFMSKIVGLGRVLSMRKKHAEGLKYVRGYVATTCFWSLLNNGLLDEIREKGSVEIKDFAERRGLALGALGSICEYLDGIKVIRYMHGRCSLVPGGKTLLEEPRGLFDLLYGYEPVLREIENLLKREKTYGKDVWRRGDAVARGSGELGRQFPFLAVRELVFSNGFRRVLDIGCGDLEFLFLLCERPDIACFGIDNDARALECAQRRLKQSDLRDRITVTLGDMFEVEDVATRFRGIDAITAIDVFHEYLLAGPDKVIDLLSAFRRHFPEAHLVVAEFFKLPHKWLRRIPTVTLEHHLLHALTNQVILPIGEWIEVFEKSGYRIVEKKLIHAIGHGYFVLK